MQYKKVQCRAVKCSAVRYKEVQCSVVKCNAVYFGMQSIELFYVVHCTALQCIGLHRTAKYTALHCKIQWTALACV